MKLWSVVILILLLVTSALAQPNMQDVLKLNSQPKSGTYNVCMNYGSDDSLNLARYYEMPVSVRYDGYSTVRDRDDYSLIINGIANVYPYSNCNGNSMDERRFKLELTWEDENRRWPIRWWQASVDDLEYELELQGLIRFIVRKNGEWEYTSSLLQYPYYTQSDDVKSVPQTVVSPPIMGSQPAIRQVVVAPNPHEVNPYPYQPFRITPSARYWRYPQHDYQQGVIYRHPFAG